MSDSSASVIPEHLQCPICFELPQGKVFQCRDGHFLCESCHSKLTECPQCRIKFDEIPIRCRAVESMLQQLVIECPHKASGCTRVTSRKLMGDHENNCHFNVSRFGELRNICKLVGHSECPFKANRGNVKDAINHFKEIHNVPVKGSELNVKFSKSTTSGESIWKVILDTVLIVVTSTDGTLSVTAFKVDGETSKDEVVKCFLKHSKDDISIRWSLAPIDIIDGAEIFPNCSHFRVSLAQLVLDTEIFEFFGSFCVVEDKQGENLWEDCLSLSATEVESTNQAASSSEGGFKWLNQNEIEDHLEEMIPLANDCFMWDFHICRGLVDNTLVSGVLWVDREKRKVHEATFFPSLKVPVTLTLASPSFAVIGIASDVNQMNVLHIPPDSTEWVKCTGEIPENAVSVGTELKTGQETYIGRVKVGEDTLLVKVIDRWCVGTWGRTWRLDECEILVLTEVGKRMAKVNDKERFSV